MQPDSARFWDPLVMQSPLSPEEKVLRERFVDEYLRDHDPFAATVRVGYLSSVAADYARLLLMDHYVQKLLADRRTAAPKNTEEFLNSQKKRLESLCWELAEDKSANHSGRVAAAGLLVKVYKMGDGDDDLTESAKAERKAQMFREFAQKAPV